MIAVTGHLVSPWPSWPELSPWWEYLVGSAVLPGLMVLALLVLIFCERWWVRTAAWLVWVAELWCCGMALIQRGPMVLWPCEGCTRPLEYVVASLLSRVTALGVVVAAMTLPMWRERCRAWVAPRALQVFAMVHPAVSGASQGSLALLPQEEAKDGWPIITLVLLLCAVVLALLVLFAALMQIGSGDLLHDCL